MEGEAATEGDHSSLMRTNMAWRTRQTMQATSSVRVLAPKAPSTAPTAPTPSQPTGEEAVIDDVGAGETHDESYHKFREEMGIAAPTEAAPRCWGFSTERFEAVRAHLAAGGDERYICRVGQLWPILGCMLEDVGYTCEVRYAERGGEAETVEPEPDDKDHSRVQTSGANSKRTLLAGKM